MSTEYKRERKEEMPVLAICYDFDKTLSPDDMQAQGFIQSVGYDVETFWKKSNGLASGNDMDQNLAYMLMMQQAAEGKKLFTRGELMKCGKEVVLFPGVKDWFKRICTYGEEHGVLVEHYIISSGLKEMIEGTDVAGEFKKIYASSFFYNEKGVAIWPAQVVNYTNKTQFLFRIEKGVLDINDPGVNDSFAPDEMRVPFRNMVYIGDSDTDVPCMKLVNVNGGYSIGVYNADTKDKTKVYKMMRENRTFLHRSSRFSCICWLWSLIGSKLRISLIAASILSIFCRDGKNNAAASSYPRILAGVMTRCNVLPGILVFLWRKNLMPSLHQRLKYSRLPFL